MSDSDDRDMYAISLDEAREKNCRKEIEEVELSISRYFWWKNALSKLLMCFLCPSLREGFFLTEEGENSLEEKSRAHLNNLRLELKSLSDNEVDGLL